MTGDPLSSQPLLIRAIVAAIVGAVVGAAAFAGAYVSRPGFVATLDGTPAPAVARGLHPSEFEAGGALSYAWTEGRVTLVFEGLERFPEGVCRHPVSKHRRVRARPSGKQMVRAAFQLSPPRSTHA